MHEYTCRPLKKSVIIVQTVLNSDKCENLNLKTKVYLCMSFLIFLCYTDLYNLCITMIMLENKCSRKLTKR